MDTRLKQRMIGAVVLTALAIIILPMLLDGSADDRAHVVASIPEAPRIELKSVSVSEIQARQAEMEAESEARLPQMTSAEQQAQTGSGGVTAANPQVEPETETGTDTAVQADPASDDELTLDENNLPVSWSLQLGSFRDPENALNLRESLRESEFRTYIIQAQTDEGEVYRVFVGPMLQRSRLAAIGEELESKFDLKGQIVRFRLEDDRGQLGG